ncbi:MAG: hypothetical protein ACOX6D_07060 [Thermoguttaceae bacterium]|jgi:hypothetical protein
MTLLEILIALSLMVFLLGFVWGMVTLFSKDYLAGEKRVSRAQLVRSVSQMLSDDLGAAVQDPISPLVTRGNETIFVRRFGLKGTESSLQIDVVEPNLLVETATLAENRAAAATSSKPARPQVPELKTVFYEFIPPNATTDTAVGQNRERALPHAPTLAGSVRKHGLSRKELSYEALETESPTQGTPVPQDASSAFGQVKGIGSLEMPRAAEENTPEPLLTAAQLAMEIDDGTVWMPEVVDCRFRYYDGKRWFTSWDSIKRNGLPTAIEADIKLMPLDDVEELRSSPLLGRIVYPPDRFDRPRVQNTSARNGKGQNPTGQVTLETAAELLELSPVMTREVIAYLPITPLSQHKSLNRRKPLPAVKGEAGSRAVGGTESQAVASDGRIGGRAFVDPGDLFPVSGPLPGEGEALGGLLAPGQAASPSPFDRVDMLVSGFDPSFGTGFEGMVSAPEGLAVPTETVSPAAETLTGVQQQWLRGKR